MNRRRVALLALGIVIAGAFWARRALGIEWDLESLRAWVESLGWLGPVGMVLLVTFRTPLLLPSQLVLLVTGIAFGVVEGTLYGAIGIVLSGFFSFGIARWLGGDHLAQRVPRGMQRTLRMAGTRGGTALLAVATAYPVGALTVYHAAAGLTEMSVGRFLLALVAGAIVRGWTYAYFGNTLVGGTWVHVAATLAVIFGCLVPLLHPRVRAWVGAQFSDSPPAGEGTDEGPATAR